MAAIAEKVTRATRDWDLPLRVAVMGCVVNGPGEAREADIGVAGAKDGFALFRRGQAPVPMRGDPAQALLEALNAMKEAAAR